jgi:hypothetical protein
MKITQIYLDLFRFFARKRGTGGQERYRSNPATPTSPQSLTLRDAACQAVTLTPIKAASWLVVLLIQADASFLDNPQPASERVLLQAFGKGFNGLE